MFGSDIIRVKIKGYLRNITENDILNFNEKGIINKNKISFINNNIKYNIKFSNNEVIMIRDGKDFYNTFVFNKKNSKSTYMIKDNNCVVEMILKTKDLFVNEKNILIRYLICDTDCEYEYKIEMSECL